MKDIREVLQERRLVIDGALGTLLEERIDKDSPIHPQNSKLWSGKVLMEEPQLIEEIHLEYIEAGADMIISSTYQLSYPSLVKYEGMDGAEIVKLWNKSIDVAHQAIVKARKPVYLVGSVGPFATYLADGSEYSGAYGQVSGEQIYNYYLSLIQFLSANPKVDVIGIETIPNYQELKVVMNILKKFPAKPFYISFNFVKGKTLPDGTPIETVMRYLLMKLDTSEVLQKNFAAMGLNCLDYLQVGEILQQLPELNVFIYPNLGYTYDPIAKKYEFLPNPKQFEDELKKWLQYPQVRAVGGCCLTTPKTIELVSKVVGQN